MSLTPEVYTEKFDEIYSELKSPDPLAFSDHTIELANELLFDGIEMFCANFLQRCPRPDVDSSAQLAKFIKLLSNSNYDFWIDPGAEFTKLLLFGIRVNDITVDATLELLAKLSKFFALYFLNSNLASVSKNVSKDARKQIADVVQDFLPYTWINDLGKVVPLNDNDFDYFRERIPGIVPWKTLLDEDNRVSAIVCIENELRRMALCSNLQFQKTIGYGHRESFLHVEIFTKSVRVPTPLADEWGCVFDAKLGTNVGTTYWDTDEYLDFLVKIWCFLNGLGCIRTDRVLTDEANNLVYCQPTPFGSGQTIYSVLTVTK